MIASKDSFEPHSSEQLPNSSRVYLRGQIHADVQVPVREIELTPTRSYTGAVTPNAMSASLASARMKSTSPNTLM